MWINNYLILLKQQNYSVHTINAYEQTLTKWLMNANMEEDMESFAFKFEETFGSLSNSTQRLKLSIIKNYYKFLEFKNIKINREIFNYKIRKETKLKLPLSKKEKILLFAKLEYDREYEPRPKFRRTAIGNYLLVQILMDSGMRAEELQQVNDFNILINSTYFVVMGKGKKEREVYWTKKTQELAKEYLIYSDKPFNSYNGIYKNLRSYGKKLDIELYPHKLRHTFASNWINNGGSEVHLSAAMGHESLATTSIYVKQDPEKIRAEHQKVIGGVENENNK